MIRVLLADDQHLVRGALAALLSFEDDITVVGEVDRGDRVREAVAAHRPDVLLLDIEMPGRDGLAVAAELRAVGDPVRVVILTTFGRPGYLSRAMDAQVAGYVLKDARAEELAAATRAVPPAEVTVPIMGHPIILRPDGPDPASIEEAERQIRARALPPEPYPWLPKALIAVAVVVLGLSFAFTLWLALAAVGAGGGAAYLLWRRREREQAQAAYIGGQLSELRELADRAVFALHEYARESAKRAEAADRDLAELTRLLRRGPRAA